MQDINSLQLIGTGEEAFNTLNKCIKEAKKSIWINVFIYRDDWHGRQLATELLNAANRGVMIHLSVDRAGVVFEVGEEGMNSLFHEKLSFKERLQAKALRVFYFENAKKEPDKNEGKGLYRQLKNHPNVVLDVDHKKDDHSKFYVFDDNVLMLGGFNIETKAFDRDVCNRRYKDYLVQFSDPDMVHAFYHKWKHNKDVSDEQGFVINKKLPNNVFEIEEHFIETIEHSQNDLIIAMAYFAPSSKIKKAILDAARRNVHITIVLPKKANLTDDLNKKSAQELVDKSDARITVCLVNYMLHAKLIISDDWVSVGSANMNCRSLTQLDELNYYSHNSKVAEMVKDDIEKLMNEKETNTYSNRTDKLPYNIIRALLEETQ